MNYWVFVIARRDRTSPVSTIPDIALGNILCIKTGFPLSWKRHQERVMTQSYYDLVVIGGGPAGHSAAIRGAQLGAKVLLVEKDKLGGTCLNYGCIPTKFLWEAVNRIEKVRKSEIFGFSADVLEGDFSSVQKKNWKNIELLSKGLKGLVESYGIQLVSGAAKFTGKNKIEIASAAGAPLPIEFSKAIIACGSSPKELPNLKIDHSKVIDSTDILKLAEAPKSLLIVGGGAIGIEMATIFSSFGAEVWIVEKENQLLPGEDAELSEEIKKNLVRSGVSVKTGTEFADDMRGKFEKILLVVGRKPNIDGLWLERADVSYGKNGILVNEYLETSAEGIYAAGDINGNAYFAYTAASDGIMAAENTMGSKNKAQYASIPKVVFSNPVSASAGEIGEKMKDKVVTGKFPFSANSRAFVEGERTGWVKVSVNRETGEILSGQIIGANADELISILSIIIRNKMKLENLRRELFFHPGFSETLFCAIEDSMKKCVELPKKQ